MSPAVRAVVGRGTWAFAHGGQAVDTGCFVADTLLRGSKFLPPPVIPCDVLHNAHPSDLEVHAD